MRDAFVYLNLQERREGGALIYFLNKSTNRIST